MSVFKKILVSTLAAAIEEGKKGFTEYLNDKQDDDYYIKGTSKNV